MTFGFAFPSALLRGSFVSARTNFSSHVKKARKCTYKVSRTTSCEDKDTDQDPPDRPFFVFRKPEGSLSWEDEKKVTEWVHGNGSLPSSFSSTEEKIQEVDVPEDAPERLYIIEQLPFPRTMSFKAVGTGGDDFQVSLRTRIGTLLGRPISDDEFSCKSTGKFISVLMKVDVESASQVYEIFKTIREDDRLKFTY